MTDARTSFLLDALAEAFRDLVVADPAAFRRKFRAMAADPFAFYRGTACLFYADLRGREDRWADERTGRVWIQGDLHSSTTATAPRSPSAPCRRTPTRGWAGPRWTAPASWSRSSARTRPTSTGRR